MVDNAVAEHEGAWVGRSIYDAPDVDSVVYLTQTDHELKPGDIVRNEIVASRGYDLIGVAVGPPK